MIVQTMTDDEITAQMEMDLQEVRAKAVYKQKEFCRLIIKSTSFPVVAAPFGDYGQQKPVNCDLPCYEPV